MTLDDIYKFMEKECDNFKYRIDYDIRQGYVVNSSENYTWTYPLYLNHKDISMFPFKFGTIHTSFIASSTSLASLINSPDYVRDHLLLDGNLLQSLKGISKHVGVRLSIKHNPLLINCENFTILNNFIRENPFCTILMDDDFAKAFTRFNTIADIISL